MKNESCAGFILHANSFKTVAILEKLFYTSGCDFGQYEREFIERRITHIMLKYNITIYEDFISKLSNDPIFGENVLYKLSIFLTEFFRDSEVFSAIRKKVIPILRTYPFIKIWHAGCSTGEEVYSMAILLHEEGLLKRTKIYATDINQQILLSANRGKFSLEQFQVFYKNYRNAGGKENLLQYFTEIDGRFVIKDFLKESIFFSHHNLVKDQILNNINMIVCRNVFLYFNKNLQQRILQYFCKSLVPRGILCIGLQEKLELIDGHQAFEGTFNNLQIYQKKLDAHNYV